MICHKFQWLLSILQSFSEASENCNKCELSFFQLIGYVKNRVTILLILHPFLNLVIIACDTIVKS